MKWPPCKYERVREFPLPRRKVWELVSQTDHLNRMIGLFAIQATPPEAGGLRRRLEAKVFGLIPLKWDEHPFEWKKNESYTVVRDYVDGPMKRFYGGVELFDGDLRLSDGERSTRVRLFAEFTPANLVGRLAIPVVGESAMKKTLAYLEKYLELEQKGQGHLLPEPKSQYRVDTKRLDLLLEKLREQSVEPALLGRLREHLLVRGDDEVMEMRPNEWCGAWGGSRDQALRLLLYATKAGITNLSWHLICPNCRVTKAEVRTLSELKPEFHCDFCGISYEADFDRSVELRFSVHPQIRTAYKSTYCIGGPAIFPHIEAQRWVQPRETAVLPVPPAPHKLRLRVLKANHAVSLTDNTPAAYRYDGAGWQRDQAQASVPSPSPDQVVVQVVNSSEQPIVLSLEREDWDESLVTAAYVSTLPEFRSLFSSEVLAPGTEVGIETLTVLFSDLLGSTAYYEQVGDARAYGQVRRHFAYMRRWIEEQHGSIVKTIGDAVMAVFASPQAGLEAAAAIQLHIGEFNRDLPSDEQITIKLGLHVGAAIAVNSNDRLDYFGRTVNLASRIQSMSRGGDIVVSRELADDPAGRSLIEQSGCMAESFTTVLKGIEEPLELVRLIPQNSPNL